MSAPRRRANGTGSAPLQRRDGQWWCSVRYRDARTGERKRKTLYGRTPAEAEAGRDDFIRGVGRGFSREMTLAEWCDYWLRNELRHGLKYSTISGYESACRLHIAPTALGQTRLRDIERQDIIRWLDVICDSPHKPATQQKYFVILKSTLEVARHLGLVGDGLFFRVEGPMHELPPVEVPTERDVRSLLRGGRSHDHYALWSLLASTGLRIGEALALEWSDIDLIDRKLYVRKTVLRTKNGLDVGKPKTKRSRRTLDINLKLYRVLSEHGRQATGVAGEVPLRGWVFATDSGERLDPANARRSLYAEVERLGCVSITNFHCLRHWVATRMVHKGVDIDTVSRTLGHSDSGFTLRRYVHGDPAAMKSALEQLGDVFDDDEDDCDGQGHDDREGNEYP